MTTCNSLIKIPLLEFSAFSLQENVKPNYVSSHFRLFILRTINTHIPNATVKIRRLIEKIRYFNHGRAGVGSFSKTEKENNLYSKISHYIPNFLIFNAPVNVITVQLPVMYRSLSSTKHVAVHKIFSVSVRLRSLIIKELK